MSMTLTHPETIGSLPPPVAAEVQKKPRLRLDFLDGLRGLAALWVVGCHVASPLAQYYLPWGFHHWQAWALCWVPYGHLMVDMFIVLSGFCLMLPVARSGSLSGGALGFYARRARRILPPYLAAIGCSALLLMLRHVYDAHILFSKGMLVSLVLLQDLVPTKNIINPPTWTVAVEWKIYFLLPLLIWAWRRSSVPAVLTLAALIGAGFTLGLHWLCPGMSLNYTCPWYVFLFGMGVCAAVAAFGPQRQRLSLRLLWAIEGIAAAGLIWLLYHPAQLRDWLWLTDTVTGAVVAAGLALLGSMQGREIPPLPMKILSWRPLVFFGTFAYSIYLMHYPQMMLLQGLLDSASLHRHPFIVHHAHILLVIIGIPVILAGCYGFFLLFERPFLNTKNEKPVLLTGNLHYAAAPISHTQEALRGKDARGEIAPGRRQ